MTRFGAYLLQKLKERGMSQSELSRESGISDAHISRLSKEERGLPKVETLARIGAALRISLLEMLKDLGYISPPMESLPENLRVFLKSELKPEDITPDEVETLSSFSFYEGEVVKPEGYAQLLTEQRNRPLDRIARAFRNQTPEVCEDCAKMVETFIRVFGQREQKRRRRARRSPRKVS
jgi:transcriptional regulator with XRE-family HTH domain